MPERRRLIALVMLLRSWVSTRGTSGMLRLQGRYMPTLSARKSPTRGLYDMHGNVWEWCEAWAADYPSGSTTDPTGAASGSDRVLRGGGWDLDAEVCRSASRFGFYPSPRYDGYGGFRVALSPSGQ